uniref:Angiopoietin-related protein 7-like n=1 Tax=Stegastes partitus TaxID=144197 RepID=A0A3B5BJ39_9TELE
MFRCTDEVSYWLHENEERKQQIAVLKETISELQEELRNHRHRIKVLELQVRFPHGLSRLWVNHQQQSFQLCCVSQTTHAAQLTFLDLWRCPTRGSQIPCVDFLLLSLLSITPPSEIQHARSCPIDCASIYYNGVRRSGLYTVVPSMAGMSMEVYCDMDTDGGGWTVIQRRVDGSVNFDRSWRDYRDGFGDLHSEFWLGNDHIHDLSTQGDYSLRIDMEDWGNRRNSTQHTS